MHRESVMGHEKRVVAAALLVLALSIATACERTPADDRGVGEPTMPTGGTVAGLIVRDDATRVDISSTADAELPEHDALAGPLSLVITKSRYRLDVLSGETRIKTYPIALGGSPLGAKQMQGDSRTPEGEYLLFPHHPSPSFGGSFYVAYPNEIDALQGFAAGRVDERRRDRILDALRKREKPPYQTALGGLILIHGTKSRWVPGLTRTNWTDGCIAMENDDIQELLGAFDADDRPVVRVLP